MKLGTFALAERTFPGILFEDRVVDLDKASKIGGEPTAFTTMRAVLENFQTVLALLPKFDPSDQEYTYSLEQLQVLAPLADPPKIICIGLNYLDHAKESGQFEVPTEPVFFNKFNTSIVGPGAAVELPRVSREVDYEAELALVIGKRGKRIPEAEALDYVFGYTAFNDISARDLQFRGGQWIKGKALDTFAPTGPHLVTVDEIGDPHTLRIQMELNGRIMQDSSTANLIFRIPYLISFLSELFTLEVGDIIATGTPPGVGFARKPPVFLKNGDQMTVTIDKIGSLTNPVKGE